MTKYFLQILFYLHENLLGRLVKKYGGKPLVYIVKPVGMWFNTINTEYIADKAMVVGKVE